MAKVLDCVWCKETPEQDYANPVMCKCRVYGCPWRYEWFSLEVWNQMNQPETEQVGGQGDGTDPEE